MPELLGEDDLDRKLRKLDDWKPRGKFITRTFEFEDFMEGIKFVEQVAKVAEGQEHHPDIHVRYTTVRLDLQTHSEGGVTEWDVDLARAIDRLAKGRSSMGRS